MSVDRVLSIAQSQVGEGEHPPFSNHNKFTVWYNANVAHIGDGAWCDMFVTWVGSQAGESHAVGRFAYCPSHVAWFKANGRWGHTPRKGAVVFFDWNGDGTADHVGFVKAVNGSSITTLEGNSGNTGGGLVREVSRSGFILGYGYPPYSSAPSGGGGTPTPTPKPTGHASFPGRVMKLTSPYMHGSDVDWVQTQLNKRGYKLSTDGVYGPQTRAAVKSFQGKNGLANDGEVGKYTWAKL
jgi:hypothetical protein